MRTVGTLRWKGGRRPCWQLDVEPHVAITVKRLFGRVRQARTGTITIADTDEVAHDLEWFMLRYPLEMDGRTQSRLTNGAQQQRDRQERIVQVLNGEVRTHGLHEPAVAPRDYQLVAAELAMATGQLLVADDVGLGKTFTGGLVLRADGALPALVVTHTHLTSQWERELNRFLPWLKTHVLAKAAPYDLTDRFETQPELLDNIDEQDEAGRQPDVLISSYHKLAGWADHLAGTVRTVLFDEAQELRRSTSQKYKAAAMIAGKATFRVGLSASPVYNYGGEIHNVMDVLAPGALGTRDEFIREWGAGSRDDKVKVANPAALGAYLREQGLMIRRTRAQVGRELPPQVPIAQPVHADASVLEKASSDAAEMARLILDQNTKPQDRFLLSQDLDWRLRQATGIAKAPYVAAFVRMLLDSEDKVLVAGYHRAVYDLWMEQLAEFNPVMHTGSETAHAKDMAVDRFVNGDARVLLMSLRSGPGRDGLQQATNVVVFGELDWSPMVHEQLIGRVRRDGQHDPTLVYYLHAEDGADPVMIETLNIKRGQSEPLTNPDGATFQKVADPDRIRRLAEDVLARQAAS